VPELPEVETIRRHLAPVLERRTVHSVVIHHPRLVRYQPGPAGVPERLQGRRLETLGRRGKYLIAELDDGHLWVTHLGMSGRLDATDPGAKVKPHTRVVVSFVESVELRMVDPRTFGFVMVLDADELAGSGLSRLGRDALDDLPSAGEWQKQLESRRAAVKTLLLDQRFVAGIGNIYADEILHRAGIRGDRPAGSLSGAEVEGLRAAVVPVLEDGLRWGGTSLGDLAYLLPDGRVGGFGRRLRVYGREGEPCLVCRSEVRRMVVSGRSSFWCPRCQR
jgi:formamidopyrimidine-DNA glycosylase